MSLVRPLFSDIRYRSGKKLCLQSTNFLHHGTSKSWLGLDFVALACLVASSSAAVYHRMQDKFDFVDRSCRGREDQFDEAWEEYRALARNPITRPKPEGPCRPQHRCFRLCFVYDRTREATISPTYKVSNAIYFLFLPTQRFTITI